ncbi:MAG: hypothetical protein R6V23_16200 [Bacteroidales bacterium]
MEPTQTTEQTVTFWIDRVELVNLQTYYNQVEILEVINRSNGKALVKVKIKDLPGFLQEITF